MPTVTLSRGALADALSTVARVVSAKSNIPILSCALLRVSPIGSSVQGTDLERWLSVEMGAPLHTGHETVCVALPVRELLAALEAAPDQLAVSIAWEVPADDGRPVSHFPARVSIGAVSVTVAARPAADFPTSGDMGDELARFSMPAPQLARAVEVTAPFVSREETRFYLRGAYMHAASPYDGGGVRFVATDGHRLARHSVAVEGAGMEWGAIIPEAALKTLASLAKGKGDAFSVTVHARHVRFERGAMTFDARTVDGTYPDYGRCVPPAAERPLIIPQASLSLALATACSVLPGRSGRAPHVVIEPTAGGAWLFARGDGDAYAEGFAGGEAGDATQIGVNGRYLTTIFKAMGKGTAEARLSITHPSDPIRIDGCPDTVFVLMPVRVDGATRQVPPTEEIPEPDPVPPAPAATAGQVAYEEDLAACPVYHDGPPRKAWSELGAAERETWERNPTPRSHAAPSEAIASAPPAAVMDGATLRIRAGAYQGNISVGEITRHWEALSHVPDRRARFELEALGQRLGSFFGHVERLRQAAGLPPTWAVEEAQRFAERHVGLTRAAWAADGRCMSSFIVGPAKFPVATNRKRQTAADNAHREVRDHVAKAREAVRRRAWPHGAPGEAIRADNPDAPDLIRERIEQERQFHARAIMVNAAARQLPAGIGQEEATRRLMDETGISWALAERVAELLAQGVSSPMNTASSLAELKRLEARLASIVRNRAAGEVETVFTLPDGGTVRRVENGEAARIQLFFDGTPTEEIRQELKARAFRWAPSVGAWQRQLTNNARWATDGALKEIGAVPAAPPAGSPTEGMSGASDALPSGPNTIEVGGRLYRVTTAFDGAGAVEQANAYLAKHADEGVIAERDGTAWCARKDDLGTPALAASPVIIAVDMGTEPGFAVAVTDRGSEIIILGEVELLPDRPPRCPDTPDMFSATAGEDCQ